MHCDECGTAVTHGPQGGYVCGSCLHTEEPPGYEKRRREGRQRAAEERRARTAARRAGASRSVASSQ